MAVKAFLSYSHKDKKLAGALKRALSRYGLGVFLAHDDVSPPLEWQRTIVQELKDCDVFLPLLTNKFPTSKWTDQETGMAEGLEKVIIPLKVELNPYGFVAKYQALKVRPGLLEEMCERILLILAKHPRTARKLRDGIIDLFLDSSSFQAAAANGQLLSKLTGFSEEQIRRLLIGSAKNNNIFGGWKARDHVEALASGKAGKITKRLLAEFRKKARRWDGT